MENIIQQMTTDGTIPAMYNWFPQRMAYLGYTGSRLYGAEIANSDSDLFGVVIPPIKIAFPYHNGYIAGFGKPPKLFENWHTLKYQFSPTVEVDVTIFSLMKFMHLLAEGTPNCIELLFTPIEHQLINHKVMRHLQDNANLFFHHECTKKYIGYSLSVKPNNSQTIEKSMYVVARILMQLKQIMDTQCINLRDSAEYLRAIRNGKVSEHEFNEFTTELRDYINRQPPLPPKDDTAIIKVVKEALELAYGLDLPKF